MDETKLRAELERDEAKRLKPYDDGRGKITIGIGRNLTDVGISGETCYQMLNEDIERVIADLDQYLPWWRGLDEVRQRVLANMAFNMGANPNSNPPGKLLTFVNTLKKIQTGDYEGAAKGMLSSVWAIQVKARADRLAEAMRTGVMPVKEK